MYYRGDDFGANPQVPDQPVFDSGATESIQPYANTPTSDIRAAELAAGRDVASSGFTGGGGFLQQAGGVLKTFGLFFSPFLPILAPALAATPVIGAAIQTGSKLANLGGALRPTIEAITTVAGATTTGREAISSAPSGGSSTAPPPKPSILSTPVAPGAPVFLSVTPDLLSQARLGQVQPRSRPIPRSRRPSLRRPKISSAAVRRLLQQ